MPGHFPTDKTLQAFCSALTCALIFSLYELFELLLSHYVYSKDLFDTVMDLLVSADLYLGCMDHSVASCSTVPETDKAHVILHT